MNIFLASPFSQFCEGDSDIIVENRWFFERLIKFFKKNKFDYFCSQERENWGENYVSPEESIICDVNGIKDCDLFVAIPGNPISGGVHVEIGWASAYNKKMLVFLDKNIEYSPMILGLKELTDCTFIYYDDLLTDETVDLIIKSIKEVI
ncbi:MAG: hypothetical protein IJS56_01515 [Bacilli bacterium]|nr:hypothetical protein [Bacilli bacterium]